jgi:hypothetical protein
MVSSVSFGTVKTETISIPECAEQIVIVAATSDSSPSRVGCSDMRAFGRPAAKALSKFADGLPSEVDFGKIWRRFPGILA